MSTRLIHTEEFEGFTVSFFADPEDCAPEDSFDDCCADTVADIQEGRCEWFAARVTASLEGRDLATDYLGCCAYVNFSDFVTDDGYYADMRRTVVSEARAFLSRNGLPA